MLWKAGQSVGSQTGDYGTVHTVEDACRIVVDTSMKADTPQSKIMSRMDTDDMLAGCTDVLEDDVRLGYLPKPSG
jgi:hypothetical protein